MPAASGQAANNNNVLLERIEGLKCDMQELKSAFDGFAREQREFRLDYEKRHAEVVEKVNSAHSRLDQVEKTVTETVKEVDEVREMAIELQHTNKILIWLGGLAGSSIILWFIGQILNLI